MDGQSAMAGLSGGGGRGCEFAVTYKDEGGPGMEALIVKKFKVGTSVGGGSGFVVAD